MIVLEVRLNGELLAVAGREDLCVLNTIVDAVGKLGPISTGTKVEKDKYNLHLNIGGLSSASEEGVGHHLCWYDHQPISVGDEVNIRVLENSSADKPIEREPAKPSVIEEAKRRHWEASRDFYLKHREKYEANDG